MRARGIGEEIEHLGRMPECFIVITKNGTKPSTGEMYRRLGEKPITKRPDTDAVADAILRGDLQTMCRGLYNVFIPACEDQVAQDMAFLTETDALGVGLSGSGPSVFAVFDNSASAANAAEKLKSSGRTAYICQITE